jgi:hypothetical protein
MKHNYSRKTRQLKHLVKKLRLALASAETSKVLIERLKLRISLLLKELSGSFSKFQLKGMLGSLAIVFGLATSSTAQTFATAVQNPFGHTVSSPVLIVPITSVDIDNDGDMDIFQGGGYGSIQFFENTGTSSAPAFSAAVTNPFGLISVVNYPAPAAADMDNDGDMDLLVGDYNAYGGQIQYFENTGTSSAPAFAAPVANPFGLSTVAYISMLTVADIDNDGDSDILTGEYYGDLIYFENTGSASVPAFAAAVTNPFGIVPPGGTVSVPNFGDLDGDGDFDLMVGENSGSMFYYENTGTASAPAFAAAVTNPFGLTSVYYYAGPHFVNLDGDCDLDLMVSEYAGTLNYFENTVAPVIDATVTTVGLTITANEAAASYAWVDCNNGNSPILGETSQSFTATANGSYAVEVTTNCGTVTSACVAITTVGLSENPLFNGVSLYPNPTNGNVTVDLGSLNSASLKVTGMNGQVVYEKENIEAVSHQFNLNESAGVYFVEISSNGESRVLKLVKK